MNNFKKISKWFKKNRESVIRTSYIAPILIAAGISVYHVVSWYGMMNPMSWAIYLSVGVEIAALSALAGMTTQMNKFVYVPFFIVTLIQFIGNIFATFEYIDVDNTYFQDWVLLVEPFFDSVGLVDKGDVLSHRRFLATLGGAFIPIISLSFLHMLVSFNDKQKDKKKDKIDTSNDETNTVENSDESEVFEDKKEEDLTENVQNQESSKEEVFEVVDDIEKEKKEELEKEKDFQDFVNRKKQKLKEDRKVFIPLLKIFYKNGEIKKGDIMPTYPEFKDLVKDVGYSDDNVKMFLTLCNYLEITQLSDNTRTATKSYDEAKKILESYLSLEDDKSKDKTSSDYLTQKWHKNRRD